MEYYRKLDWNYGKIVNPFTELLKKKVTFIHVKHEETQPHTHRNTHNHTQETHPHPYTHTTTHTETHTHPHPQTHTDTHRQSHTHTHRHHQHFPSMFQLYVTYVFFTNRACTMTLNTVYT